MDLFARTAAKDRRGQPLAERMRPRTLAEFVGQEHLLGPGKLLRRALEAKELPSLILWGPPGTARRRWRGCWRREAGARFVPLSAVLAGVKDLREAVAEAGDAPRSARRAHGAVHRRDPPLQQGAAGRAAAARRGGHGHADRRHHREPVVRGERRAAVARQGGRAARRCRRPTCARVIDRALADKERGLGRAAARRAGRRARSDRARGAAATRGAR